MFIFANAFSYSFVPGSLPCSSLRGVYRIRSILLPALWSLPLNSQRLARESMTHRVMFMLRHIGSLFYGIYARATPPGAGFMRSRLCVPPLTLGFCISLTVSCYSGDPLRLDVRSFIFFSGYRACAYIPLRALPYGD